MFLSNFKNMHTIDEYFPKAADPADLPRSVGVLEETSPLVTDASVSDGEALESGQTTVSRAAKVGMHTVVTGLVSWFDAGSELLLTPDQVIPFSLGWDQLSRSTRVRYHQGIHRVNPQGLPHPEATRGRRTGMTAGCWAWVTEADTICGFSGRQYAVNPMSLSAAARTIAYADGECSWDAPGAPDTFVRTGLSQVRPSFWMDADSPRKSYLDGSPVIEKWDVVTRRTVRLFRLTDWHLMSPSSSLAESTVGSCEARHGGEFLTNRIYVAGGGLGRLEPVPDPSITGNMDFHYHTNGYHLQTAQVIGEPTPAWVGGLLNRHVDQVVTRLSGGGMRPDVSYGSLFAD